MLPNWVWNWGKINMLTQALGFLLEVGLGLFVYAFLLRFLFQLLRVPSANPLGKFIQALTDFAVKPVRRVVPGWRGVDWTTLLLAWLTQFLLLVALIALKDFPFVLAGPAVWFKLLLLGGVGLLRTLIQLYVFIILIQAVLSWVQPYTPLTPVLDALTRPILGPLRRVVPLIGGVDLSPLLAIVLAQLLLMLPVAWLEMSLRLAL